MEALLGQLLSTGQVFQLGERSGSSEGRGGSLPGDVAEHGMQAELSSADSDPRVEPPTCRVQGILSRPTGEPGLPSRGENEDLGAAVPGQLQSQDKLSPGASPPVTSPLEC